MLYAARACAEPAAWRGVVEREREREYRKRRSARGGIFVVRDTSLRETVSARWNVKRERERAREKIRQARVARNIVERASE